MIKRDSMPGYVSGFCILILMVVACQTIPPCTPTSILDMKMDEKVMLLDTANLTYVDKGKDTTIGGTYYFHSGGKLSSYKFFGSADAYTYNVEFDKAGKLVFVQGKPIPYKRIKEVNSDSLFIIYHLSTLLNKFSDVTLVVDQRDSFMLDIQADTLYSNMNVASAGLNIKQKQRVSLLLRLTATNKCSGETTMMTDITSLVTDPELHFATQ